MIFIAFLFKRILLFGLFLLPVIVKADKLINWTDDFDVYQFESKILNDQLIFRERGTISFESEEPSLVVDVVRVEQVNDEDIDQVLFEMKKRLQKDFLSKNFQAICSKIRKINLYDNSWERIRCGVFQYGKELMKQDLLLLDSTENNVFFVTYAIKTKDFLKMKKKLDEVLSSLNIK